MALVDALGNLARFALLSDKALDADWLREELDERGAMTVIPPRRNRKMQYDYDTDIYKWRHLIENHTGGVFLLTASVS